MSAGQRTLIVWAVIAVVAYVVLRRIGIAALFGKSNPAEQPTIYGGGGAGDGVTAPGVSPTPTTATQAHVTVLGDPVGQTVTPQATVGSTAATAAPKTGLQIITSTIADRAADFSRVTYKSPGPTDGYGSPKGAVLQNVQSGGKTVPVSLSDFAVANKIVLPGAMTAPSNPSGPVSW